MDPMAWLPKNRYGSLALSREAGPNLLRGFAGSVFLHGFFVVALFALTLVNASDHTTIDKVPPGPIIVLPKLPPMPMPPVHTELQKPNLPNPADVPVPVEAEPIQQIDPAIPQGPVGVPGPVEQPGTGVPGELGQLQNYGMVGISDDPIPGPDEFIPFEVAPSALSINPQPAYPEAARISGISGKVTIRVFVDRHGDARQWEVLSASPPNLGFAEEVLKVIGRWKFSPAIQQGNPIGLWVAIPFKFKCEK